MAPLFFAITSYKIEVEFYTYFEAILNIMIDNSKLKIMLNINTFIIKMEIKKRQEYIRIYQRNESVS